METEERETSGDSAKTSKTGGNRVKALTAEEGARRREMVMEKLREKLELEKRALNVVRRLLEDRVAEDFLADCAKFITLDNYKDTIEERSIAKLCGYPICPNRLGKVLAQRYSICTKTNKVYDITERKCFCSNFCYKASKEFELQISQAPLWLRQHESLPEIKLLKKGDGGRSGEEVLLTERRLQEEDVENLLISQPKDHHSSKCRAEGGHSDGSDMEQELDCSVVSQRQGSRVHWGELPKRTDEDGRGKVRTTERKRNGDGHTEEIAHQCQEPETKGKLGDDEKRKESRARKMEARADAEQVHLISTDVALPEEKLSVEEGMATMNLCSLSETGAHTVSLPVGSTPAQAEPTTPLASPPLIDSIPPEGDTPLSPATLEIHHLNGLGNATIPIPPGLGITQVGMSKKGAAGLRDLLKSHTAAPKPSPVLLNLRERLRRTLTDWRTDETLKFLYGADHSLGSPFTDVKKVEPRKEEELDEDDLEDEATEEGGTGDEGDAKRPSAAAPDYETLRKETQQLELRVREFYKGAWILAEDAEAPNEHKVTVQDRGTKDPALPPVDSRAQHLIQKRITAEKLNNCLRNIVGPLHLTMSDVTADVNSLVRTFRFTNTNIMQKTPEWTLIAVVLLRLLSEVSPVVREALETTASVEYLNALMEGLGLQEQDLLNLVNVFKAPSQSSQT